MDIEQALKTIDEAAEKDVPTPDDFDMLWEASLELLTELRRTKRLLNQSDQKNLELTAKVERLSKPIHERPLSANQRRTVDMVRTGRISRGLAAINLGVPVRDLESMIRRVSREES